MSVYINNNKIALKLHIAPQHLCAALNDHPHNLNYTYNDF